MPFDGNGTFSRLMNWVQDAAAGIKIKSDRHDQNDDDIAAGLTNCLTKDGQTQPTDNIPMNGKKLVNLGTPTVDTDAATKAYVDTLKAFSKGLEITGADGFGRLSFTSTTGINGLSFTGADLGWFARLADASATPPKLNRMALNDKPDGSGTDVITANDDGSLVATKSVTAPEVDVKPTTGQGKVVFYGADGTVRMTIAIDSGAQGDATLTVADKVVTFGKDGTLKATANLIAGTAQFQTNGDVNGSIWNNWGSLSAFTAINARIESRATAWANDRIQNLQYRKTSLGYNATSGGFTNIGGAVIVGYAREGGNTGQVAGLYYMYLQVYDPVRGWVGFSG